MDYRVVSALSMSVRGEAEVALAAPLWACRTTSAAVCMLHSMPLDDDIPVEVILGTPPAHVARPRQLNQTCRQTTYQSRQKMVDQDTVHMSSNGSRMSRLRLSRQSSQAKSHLHVLCH